LPGFLDREAGFSVQAGPSSCAARLASTSAPIVCVQNLCNLAHRHDDELLDRLAEQGIAYVPFFPLGGFSPLQSSALSTVAARLDATPMAVALAPGCRGARRTSC
jgi:aryl-alcohol dehydrogenase-like predicted oxidoreductase